MEKTTQSPRRVLFLTSSFPRWQGDSTPPFVLHLAQDLTQLGWSVDVLAPHAPGARTQERLDGIEVHRFRYFWPERYEQVCYQGGALVNLRKNKLNYLALPGLVFSEFFASLRRLQPSRYSLLHSHWLLPQGMVGVLAARLRRLPHITTVHGGDVFGLRNRWLRSMKRSVVSRVQGITVNSSATEKAVRELLPSPKLLQRIPMGVPDRFTFQPEKVQEIRARYGLENRFSVCFVGRIVEEKGVKDLIEAVDRLQRGGLDLRCLVLGEGQDRLDCEALVRDRGLEPFVHFVGWVPSAEIPNYLKAVSAFAGPSKRAPDGWVEAQGLTFLEAMMMGTPVVATRSGGISDFAQHEQTALLVEENSPQQIAAMLARLASEPGLSERLSQDALSMVQQNYTRSASARAFSDLYEKVLSQKHQVS